MGGCVGTKKEKTVIPPKAEITKLNKISSKLIT